MRIDKEYRIKAAKLHSAGHILDVAVSNLKLPWKPGKGYHF
jgi:Ser-tRNA(Ala) deacylase AlaX